MGRSKLTNFKIYIFTQRWRSHRDCENLANPHRQGYNGMFQFDGENPESTDIESSEVNAILTDLHPGMS